MWIWSLCPHWGPRAKPLVRAWGKVPPHKLTTLVKMCYFVTVLTFKNDSNICIYCLHAFNMKWKKNQVGGRKVVGQATMLAQWAQKVGGRLPSLPSRLRRQC